MALKHSYPKSSAIMSTMLGWGGPEPNPGARRAANRTSNTMDILVFIVELIILVIMKMFGNVTGAGIDRVKSLPLFRVPEWMVCCERWITLHNGLELHHDPGLF